MKLSDLKSIKGTYAALRVLPPSAGLIKAWCKQNVGKNLGSAFEQRLHVTLLYSRTPAPNHGPSQQGVVHTARVTSLTLFDDSKTKEKTVLVARLNAPTVYARHVQLMANNPFATYDFPTYEPHVTLSYSFSGDLATLPPLDFDILLGEEYYEDLS